MADNSRGYFTQNGVSADFFDLMCGERLGGGVARDVYVSRLDPDLVVKIEHTSGTFQNQMEWRVWENLSHDKDARKWLAPCVHISPCGSVLVQRRTAPLRRAEMARHKQLPKFLTDVKMSNFGILGGKLVCHDYGIVRWSYDTGLRKAVWGV